MSSPAVQLSFALRTSPNVRTVHLLGSWDGYKSQLPLSALKDPAAKPGSWKGTFRFQGAHALKLGSRYWYYYIVDGYHVSHDPAKEHVVEKTTGRKLNVLNVPAGDAKRPAPISVKPDVRIRTTQDSQPKTPTTARIQVPVGRAPSPGKIYHPRPQKPYASQGLREADYDASPIEDLEERFAGTKLSDRTYLSSPSDLSDLSEGSSGTVFSSCSDNTSSCTSSDDDVATHCRCNRFGLTRDGRRVMLDCGGKRCGYSESDSSSACDGSSSDGATSEEEEEEEDDDDDNDDEYQREMELKRRARAQLVAERTRNGVVTTANARLNTAVGLPPTPRLPRQQSLAIDTNVKQQLPASRPRQTRERDVDTSTKARQPQPQPTESTRARAGGQEQRRRR